jgi:HD superfamily phosphodiesterase
MTNETLQGLSSFFDSYTQQFLLHYPQLFENLSLKIRHSQKVRENIRFLSQKEKLSKGSSNIAEAIALFHDIGRFKQYTQYNTFSDENSVDHGHLGVSVLKEENVLKKITETSKQIIYKGVEFHNKKELPADVDEDSLFFIKLIKDADKLDIYRIVTEHYLSGNQNKKLTLDLDQSDAYNPICIEQIRQHKIIDKHSLTTVTDFKLLQVSWVFELYFSASFSVLKKHQYIEKIFSTLPDDGNISCIKAEIKSYLQNHKKTETVNS